MYGWFVKRLDTGRFLSFRADDPAQIHWVNTRDEAECFSTRAAAEQAFAADDNTLGMPVRFEDATLHDAPLTDADTLPVESFSEIVERVKAAGQPRRDATAKARAEKGARPAPFETQPLVKRKPHPKRSKLAAPAIGKPRPKIINAKAKLKLTKRKLPR